MPKGKEFPPEVKTQALELLRSGLTFHAVERQLGVNRATLYKWNLRRADILATVRTETRIGITVELGEQVAEYLSQTVEGAKVGVQTLVDVMQDPEAKRSERIRAAQILIESANSIASSSEQSEAASYIEEAAAG